MFNKDRKYLNHVRFTSSLIRPSAHSFPSFILIVLDRLVDRKEFEFNYS